MRGGGPVTRNNQKCKLESQVVTMWQVTSLNLDAAGTQNACMERCSKAGLDIVHFFPLDVFNQTAAVQERLADFGRHALAAIIGNSKFLWPRFRSALALLPSRLANANPLDRYVEESIHRACESLPIRTAVSFSHVTLPQVLPIQRIAQAAGLASVSPSHFSIHPTYGPWIGLRAVVVFDVEAPSAEPLRVGSPCENCSQPCMPPLREALDRAERDSVTLPVAVKRDWRSWARVRQVCPVGREQQYSDEQLEYHYTNDKSLLSSD